MKVFMKVFMKFPCRVFAAVIFTAFNLGRASSYATEAGKSRLAAARILTLLDRVPSIDVSSTDGEKLVCVYVCYHISSALTLSSRVLCRRRLRGLLN